MIVEKISCILCGFSAVFQPLVPRCLGTKCLECDTASIKRILDTTLFGNQCLWVSGDRWGREGMKRDRSVTKSECEAHCWKGKFSSLGLLLVASRASSWWYWERGNPRFLASVKPCWVCLPCQHNSVDHNSAEHGLPLNRKWHALLVINSLLPSLMQTV